MHLIIALIEIIQLLEFIVRSLLNPNNLLNLQFTLYHTVRVSLVKR